MFEGLIAGVLWGLDTVILGIALAMTPFVSTEQAVMLAPFVSTFVHDFCSSMWMALYMGVKKEWKNVVKAFKTRSGKFIVLGALLGGPIGMSGYVAAIKFIGPAYTAIISAIFPALGAFLSYIFLKEKMSKIQLAGLAVSILGVIGLSYAPGGEGPTNLIIGLLCALLCVFGWAAEAVICAYGLKDPDISDEHALQIRQLTSALFYGVVIMTVLGGWNFTFDILPSTATSRPFLIYSPANSACLSQTSILNQSVTFSLDFESHLLTAKEKVVLTFPDSKYLISASCPALPITVAVFIYYLFYFV